MDHWRFRKKVGRRRRLGQVLPDPIAGTIINLEWVRLQEQRLEDAASTFEATLPELDSVLEAIEADIDRQESERAYDPPVAIDLLSSRIAQASQLIEDSMT